MGKVSLISAKYSIRAKLIAEGVVEKPDVIGAIFGQTEGLLGEDLELRELQKNGKIGRIDVTLSTSEGKTVGIIEIPTSIDKTETTMIAASLETIERVGPCDAKIQIEKVEDVRTSKREYVLARAKKLLAEISSTQPDSREMEAAVLTSSREDKIREHGKERLPAGPDIESSDEIIVVEGRADVLTLLRYSIKNVIGMNGSSLPQEIKDLGKTKKITLFVDGDRGGLLEAKDAVENANIAFVARAPDGKEVEELVGKEIITALRNKITAEEFKELTGAKKSGRFARSSVRERFSKKPSEIKSTKKETKEETEEESMPEERELNDDEITNLQSLLDDLKGTKGAYLLDSKLEVIRKTSVRELSRARPASKNYALIMDGTVTNSVAKSAESIGCKHLIAKNFAVTIKTRINFISV